MAYYATGCVGESGGGIGYVRCGDVLVEGCGGGFDGFERFWWWRWMAVRLFFLRSIWSQQLRGTYALEPKVLRTFLCRKYVASSTSY